MATKSSRSSGTQINSRGITQGNTLVDPVTGFPVCVKKDNAGDYRLCVDSQVTVDVSNIDLELDPSVSGVHIGDLNTGDVMTVNPDGSINTNVEVDAADGDNIAISAHPNQIFDEIADSITTAAFEQIYTYTSTSSNSKIVCVECTVGTPSVFRLKLNGNTIKELRSSPTERNIIFEFTEHRSLSNGDILTVEAKVNRLIQNSYSTFTSIEGYLN